MHFQNTYPSPSCFVEGNHLFALTFSGQDSKRSLVLTAYRNDYFGRPQEGMFTGPCHPLSDAIGICPCDSYSEHWESALTLSGWRLDCPTTATRQAITRSSCIDLQTARVFPRIREADHDEIMGARLID
jgi:hypothetical protein